MLILFFELRLKITSKKNICGDSEKMPPLVFISNPKCLCRDPIGRLV